MVNERSQKCMIPALDPDPELEFQLFGYCRSRFGCSKKQMCYDSWLGSGSEVRFPAFLLIPDPDSNPVKVESKHL